MDKEQARLYAAEATSQVRQAASMGFKQRFGTRWSDNFNTQFQWARRVSDRIGDKERAARQEKIQSLFYRNPTAQAAGTSQHATLPTPMITQAPTIGADEEMSGGYTPGEIHQITQPKPGLDNINNQQGRDLPNAEGIINSEVIGKATEEFSKAKAKDFLSDNTGKIIAGLLLLLLIRR